MLECKESKRSTIYHSQDTLMAELDAAGMKESDLQKVSSTGTQLASLNCCFTDTQLTLMARLGHAGAAPAGRYAGRSAGRLAMRGHGPSKSRMNYTRVHEMTAPPMARSTRRRRSLQRRMAWRAQRRRRRTNPRQQPWPRGRPGHATCGSRPTVRLLTSRRCASAVSGAPGARPRGVKSGVPAVNACEIP